MDNANTFHRVQEMLSEVGLPDHLEYLIQNGFDQWDILRELNEEILNQIGITFSIPRVESESFLLGITNPGEIKKILAVINAVVPAEMIPTTVETSPREMSKELTQSRPSPPGEGQGQISKKVIYSGTNFKPLKNETHEKFLHRLLFLNLEGKKLVQIVKTSFTLHSSDIFLRMGWTACQSSNHCT